MLLGSFQNGIDAQSSMTIVLLRSAQCNTTTTFKAGDTCQYILSIGIPASNITTLYVEFFTSDVNSSYALVSQPKISIDTVAFPALTAPPVKMVTDFLSGSQVILILR